MLISICICTYNRRAILEKCLRSLGQLVDPRPIHNLEIIVVDNNSKDGTAEFVAQLTSSFRFPLKYVFEGEQGLSAARNRAVAEAKGDYLAFLDDECIVSPDWLFFAITDIEQFQPWIIGGPYLGAFLPGERPKWFKAEYGDAYFLGCHYDRGFQTDFRASGGNMFIRREVFEMLRFDINLGMNGKKLKMHEEVELQNRLLEANASAKIFYEPGIAVHHFVLPEKMRLSYRAKRLFFMAVSSPDALNYMTALNALRGMLVQLALGPLKILWRSRATYPSWQNAVYERVLPPLCYNAGTVAKFLVNRMIVLRRKSSA